MEKSEDPYLGLLSYRNTPLSFGRSPAELLMNRRLNTRLPYLLNQNMMLEKDHVELKRRSWRINSMKNCTATTNGQKLKEDWHWMNMSILETWTECEP